jgi:alanine dehydrogenase
VSVRAFSAEEVAQRLDYVSLTNAIDDAFRADITIPPRHHHTIPVDGGRDATLLLMPAWSEAFLGLKTVIVAPENTTKDLAAVQAGYQLMDRKTGQLLALMDGGELTARRTACASALAARYLSRPDARRLTMVGTGVLAPHLIAAHASQRPIDQVIIWGRNVDKARALAADLDTAGMTVRAEANLQTAVHDADIISCATLAAEPLIDGTWLQPGQHLDLVGAFTPEMREVDDTAIALAEVYLDTPDAMVSAGEICDPLARGVITEADIRGTLFDLAGAKVPQPRAGREAVTLFKSAGTAVEDLAAAMLVYDRA